MIAESINQNVQDTVNPEPFSEPDEDLFKNVLCPYYDQCLDLAAKENWPQFSCQACRFQNAYRKTEPNAHEMEGYYRLLSRVFMRKDGVLFLQ